MSTSPTEHDKLHEGRTEGFASGIHHPEGQHDRVLIFEDSPDSSNGFVKIEKPRELRGFESSGLDNSLEITPSDDVAGLTDDDFKRDYAPSPQHFASELASGAHETLEHFLANAQKTGVDVTNRGARFAAELGGQFSPVEEESSAHENQDVMYEEEEEEEEEDVELSPEHLRKAKEEVVRRMEDVQAKVERVVEPEETMYQRHGPLTLGNPVNASVLSQQKHSGLTDILSPADKHSGLTDMVHDFGEKVGHAAEAISSKVSDAAHAVSSKVAENVPIKDSITHHIDRSPHSAEHPNDKFITPEAAPMKPHEHNIVVSTNAEDTQHLFDAPQDIKGRIIDDAKEAKDVLSEFASNMTAKVTNLAKGDLPRENFATGDLLGDFESEKQPKPPAPTVQHKQPVTDVLKHAETPCSILDLIYWRDTRKSGVVFAATFAFLLCLAIFPVISVAAYTGLIIILGTLSFRLYKMILAFVHKTEQTNPFKPYLESGIKIPEDRVHQQVDVVSTHVTNLLNQLRRLFLVENVADTLKFAVLLWAMTYVGACLSVMSLVIIAFVGLFTIPKFYETYQKPIDQYYDMAHTKVKTVTDTIQEKIPQLKKKTHAE